MKISDIIEPLELKCVTEGDNSRDITGCYIGDLLSWVMSKAQSGNIWITIMTNVNIVAVASLTDVAKSNFAVSSASVYQPSSA